MTKHGDVVTIIKADNFTLWSHDMTRLLHFLDQALDIEIRHHTNGFMIKNGIKMYNDLREYYFGQNNQGVKETRTAFEQFKPRPTTTSIRQDIVRFEELRLQCEYAVDMIFNDKMNNSFLDEKFETDPRAGVIASLTATNLTKWSYRQRLDALHDLQNCDSIPAKSVNLNALAAGKTPGKEKPPCHNFAKGTCTYGDKCRYSHAKPPPPTTATAPPPSPKYN